MIQLNDGETLLDGLLEYYPQAITTPDELLQQLLTELPWHSDSITVYGQQHVIPRLQCWLGDPGLSYCYSGKTLNTQPWHPRLQQLNRNINQQLGLHNNSVLCNLYRDGQDAMGWHSDDEPELGAEPVIVSVSLGAMRDFALRRRGHSRMDCKLPLPHGSVLVMQAGMQQSWQHSLPRRAGVSQPRINLTFRQLITG